LEQRSVGVLGLAEPSSMNTPAASDGVSNRKV